MKHVHDDETSSLTVEHACSGQAGAGLSGTAENISIPKQNTTVRILVSSETYPLKNKQTLGYMLHRVSSPGL